MFISSLRGKRVLITGASSGIGLGITRGFVDSGAHVVISGRRSDKLEATVAELNGPDMEVHGIVANVADKASVHAMLDFVADTLGGLDVLCCNAGIFPSGRIDDLSEADWDQVLATNAKGTFLCVQAALPHLRAADYGRIIVTSSITGPVTGFPGWSHYGASKAAQLGFMRTAAIELARDGITINAVLPGNILTEGLQDMGENYLSGMAAAIPLMRLGSVDDIASAAMFLASREAGYITGQSLIVDGGQTLLESHQARA